MKSIQNNYRVAALLKQFGCNQREAEIFLHCLQAGPSAIQEIARKLKQNRVTVHSSVQQLISKGFLYETRKGKKRLIVAEDPEVLERLIQKKENELKLLKDNLDFVMGSLVSMQNSDASVPTVKLYEGVDGFKKMLEETLTTKGDVFVFTYVDLFSELLDPDYLEDYFVRRAKKNIYTRLIFPPCDFAYRVNKKAKEYKIQVRLLPANFRWKSGFFSWDESVSLKSFTEGTLTCTIIKNRDIAEFIQNVIFELCWQVAEPINEENDKN